MSLAELSGPFNGIIILCSASLAITQYAHNGLAGRFGTAKGKLSSAWNKIPDDLKSDGKKAALEPVKKIYDALANRECDGIGFPIPWFFVILCALAILKSWEIYLYTVWTQADAAWFGVPMLVLALATAVLLLLTANRLRQIYNKVKDYADQSKIAFDQIEILTDALMKMSATGLPTKS